jgi:ribose transport system substrate-binding protein
MRQVLLAVWIVLVLTGSGCGKKEGGSTSGKLTVAVIPKGTTHEFWKSIHAGALKAAEECGVEVIWKGPLKEDDREAQISVVEDFISRKVAGIVLAPLDDAALRAPVAGAMHAGIPVVIIDSDLQGNEYVSFVATDNFLGGQLAGKKMIELLKGKGKVVMLRYEEGSASTTKREAGFLAAIAAAPGITVTSASQFGGATTETAYKASENLLAPLREQSGKLSVDGIFTPNESTTFGMLRALQDARLAGSVIFLGFDSSTKLIEALQKGELNGLVLQNPLRMGYLGVKTLADHLRGEKVGQRIDTGVTLATRENMDQQEIRELLSPDLSRWLK